MYAAEIIVREVQGASRFQVRQPLRESVREPRESPHLHSQGQIVSLDMAGTNAVGIGPPINDLGYDLRDSWWGVPPFGCGLKLAVVAKQLHKLREVGLPRKNALNRAIEVPAVRGDLKAVIAQAPFQTP